ncbi:MAG TPA: tetratricopeptide repeat protein [Thermoanaerobaculia bacterium]|nr:tetratricopeptide repeat protein [Thermoanaerobaculia bacterium]
MRSRAKLVLLVTLAIAAGAAGGCSSWRRLDLTQSGTQLDFGVRMARANLWREALFRFERAVQIDPDNAQALNNLAVAYEGIGEFEKARETYARALRVDKSNQHIQKNYSRFVEFYSRNRKREQKLQEIAKADQEAKAKETEPEATPGPIELSKPKEPPKPGEVPVSDVPPDPVPPTPPPQPPGGAR